MLQHLVDTLDVIYKPNGLRAMYRAALSASDDLSLRDAEMGEDARGEVWTALAVAEESQPGITFLVAGYEGSYPLLDSDPADTGARDTGERITVTEDMVRVWINLAREQLAAVQQIVEMDLR